MNPEATVKVQEALAARPKKARCPICGLLAVARTDATVREHLSAHLIVHTDAWTWRTEAP
jgi:hypothetical protein